MSNDFADLIDRAKHAFEIVWIGDEYRDVLVLKLLCEYFELRRSRDQNHLRLQGNDSFETRMKRVANFSDRLCFGGKVTITRASNESIAGADCKNNLSEIWCERDDSIDRERQTKHVGPHRR